MLVKEYRQPTTLSELADALVQMTEESRLLAGGTDLIIDIKNHPREIPLLVSLCKVPELYGTGVENCEAGDDGSEPEKRFLRIGTMETHAAIAADPMVRKYARALAEACDHVGSRQVRNRGTIGGSLGNASVAGDMLPVLYLLHARLQIFGMDGNLRRIPATELIAGVGKTTLTPQEMIFAVEIPMEENRDSCFVKLGGRQEVTIAEISLGLSWARDKEVFEAVEGVLGAVDVRPIPVPEAGEILNGTLGTPAECDRLAEALSARITAIRMKRKRPPKLRIREGEREYKERAIRGVVYDAVDATRH